MIPRISSGNGDERLLIFSSCCYQNDRDLERQHFLRLSSQMKAKVIKANVQDVDIEVIVSFGAR